MPNEYGMAINIRISGIPSCRPGTIQVDGVADIRLGDLLSRHLPVDRQSLLGILFRQDKLESGYVILVNGRNITQLEGLDTMVKEDETVLIAAHVVGG